MGVTLYVTFPLLIIIFMQYMLCMENSDEGDPITILFQNKALIATILIYLLLVGLVMVVI